MFAGSCCNAYATLRAAKYIFLTYCYVYYFYRQRKTVTLLNAENRINKTNFVNGLTNFVRTPAGSDVTGLLGFFKSVSLKNRI